MGKRTLGYAAQYMLTVMCMAIGLANQPQQARQPVAISIAKVSDAGRDAETTLQEFSIIKYVSARGSALWPWDIEAKFSIRRGPTACRQ